MKRMSSFILCTALALSLTLPVSAAQTGTVVNHALYTDIVAQIDGHPLRSYNVDGRTAVVAEDLRGYGFYALWDPEDRTLKVERAVDQSGQPETPVSWPEYTPEPLTHPIGSRAQDILSTDIQVYVAGEYVQSFNINGETLIWFSDLAPYGAVEYDEDSRTANLTLAADLVQYAVEQKEQQLKDAWLTYDFQCYPGPGGTAMVYNQYGTPHGGSCHMIYVAENGSRLQIETLLPAYGFGQFTYFQPREVQFDQSGQYLTFITPVKETIPDPDSTLGVGGETKDWGDTLCKVDLATGTMKSMQPLSQPMTEWTVPRIPNTNRSWS